MNLNECLAPEVRRRVEKTDPDTAVEWGGEIRDDVPTVTNPAGEEYRDRTVVRSVDDALAAFDKYERYAEHVLATFEPENPDAVLLPCGANKPIGSSSIHARKLDAIEASGLGEHSDVLILSEPCSIVPHAERLTLAAANYDFPPEYTDKATAPEVHETFARRVATFIDAAEYRTLYAYLPAGHREVLNTALEYTTGDTDVVHVPGASFNPESGAFCGDLMQSAETIAAKLFYSAKYAEAGQ